MKKSWIVSLVCAILLSASAGYMGKSFKKEDKPKVIVILKALNTDYWKSMKAGADKAFDDFDIDGKVIAPASEYRVTEQIDMLKSILKQNPDALIVAPSQPAVAIPLLVEYHKKRIPESFLLLVAFCTLRKYKFLAGRPFDVARNFRNKV